MEEVMGQADTEGEEDLDSEFVVKDDDKKKE